MGYRGAKMKRVRFILSVLCLLLSAYAQGQNRQANASSCENSPLLAELTKPSTDALLVSYGYNLREPWACTKIESPWVMGSFLLHFRKISAQSDDMTAFSVMKVAGIAHIWIIPTESGMLEVPNADSDPHNLAAYNALIGSLSKTPSSRTAWAAVAKLYLILLGHETVVPIDTGSSQSNLCISEGECSLAFADRIPHRKEPYIKWTLTFNVANGHNRTKLIEVKRNVVSPPKASTGR
jgi:hypothetical protein